MLYQSVFQRYEIKYILTKSQAQVLKEAISGRMKIDEYGPTTIRNIYFDTDDYKLIRKSLDKPVYKEKLRLRSYRYATNEDPVFVELKKKYDGVVFKRRLEAENFSVMDWLLGFGEAPSDSQIAREITYVRDLYKELKPKAFISYTREAYVPENGSELRITFDTDVLGRDHDLSFSSGIYGDRILPDNKVLMEIKVPGVMPIWLTRLLSKNGIRKTAFSKYGEYYMNQIRDKENEWKGEFLYA